MAMNIRNVQLLSKIDGETKAAILDAIAKNIGVTPQEAYAEIAGEEAEHLLDYMVDPHRSATSVLMQRHGLR
ncbi:hypothetical protein D3C84_1202570 [compost metagenome]